MSTAHRHDQGSYDSDADEKGKIKHRVEGRIDDDLHVHSSEGAAKLSTPAALNMPMMGATSRAVKKPTRPKKKHEPI